MPNWKSAESFQRLLAAVVASQDMKLDFKKIAMYYGEGNNPCPTQLRTTQPPSKERKRETEKLINACTGATYDSIEGRFRIVKREAKALKDEVDNAADEATSSKDNNNTADNTTPTKATRGKKAAAVGTPTPKKDKVIGGRVSKTTGASNNNKNTKAETSAFGMDGMVENMMKGLKQEGIVDVEEEFYAAAGDGDGMGVSGSDGLWMMESI
ncbi:MAG: hypothetical protein Q9191_007640 [Dirinaria sp. TL-2023a]